MNMYTAIQWLCFFYIYCFLGWLWESAYVSVKTGKLTNRGFMRGPWLPIYGTGAVGILIITAPFKGHIVVMSLVGMAAAAVLEYVTGYVMEKLFCTRYWDYTGCFLSLNGYICFASVACWGVMTGIVVDFVQVRLERFVLDLNQTLLAVAVGVITPVVIADFVQSFRTAMRQKNMVLEKARLMEEWKILCEKKEELEKFLQETGEKYKEHMAAAADKAKEQMVTAADKAKEQMATAADKAKEQMATAVDKAKEEMALAADKAKEQMVLAADRAKEQRTYMGGRNRKQAGEELQELRARMAELYIQIRKPVSRDIKFMLKRNPSAVSHKYREAFAEIKASIERKTEKESEKEAEKK